MIYCLETKGEPQTLIFFTDCDLADHRAECEEYLTKRIGVRCLILDLTDAVYGPDVVPTLRRRADAECDPYAQCLRDLAREIEDERDRRKGWRNLFRRTH